MSIRVSRYLTYPQLIHRHRYLDPWSPADFLLQFIYLAINAFCIGFKAPDIKTAGLRAANLSLINMILPLAGPYLSLLADILGVPLPTYRRIHRICGMMSFSLLIFHIFIVLATQTAFPLRVAENRWRLIGGLSLCFLLFLSHPFLRQPSYEVFIRMHQALAILSAYSIGRHLHLTQFLLHPSVPQRYIYISMMIFLSTFLFQIGYLIYKNRTIGSGFSRASIRHTNGIVHVQLRLSRPLKVDAGQYISLWMWVPSVSFWCFLQSHPFTVVSWSEGEQQDLDLLIQCRDGLTQRLLTYSKLHSANSSCPALFSGPHGITEPIEDYETVLLIASGFGIATMLPYLKKLIYGYNTCKTRIRRVHLVLQLETIDIGVAMQKLLDNALIDDTLDNGYILAISIYVKYGAADKVPFGTRAIAFSGSADLGKIIFEERSGKHIQRMENETEQGDMLVMVSGDGKLRDDLREIVRGYLNEKVRLVELEYQPA